MTPRHEEHILSAAAAARPLGRTVRASDANEPPSPIAAIATTGNPPPPSKLPPPFPPPASPPPPPPPPPPHPARHSHLPLQSKKCNPL